MTTSFVFLHSADGSSAIHPTVQDLADAIALGLDCDAPTCASVADLEKFLKFKGEAAPVFESLDSLSDSELTDLLDHARAVGDPFGVSVLEDEIDHRIQRTARHGTGLPIQTMPI